MDLFAQNKSHVSTKEITSYEIKQKGNHKILFDFEEDCTFKHGDKITNLIKARLLEKYEKEGTIAPDTAKYICFEIPPYITIDELAEKKVFDILNQVGKFNDLMENNYNNMGLIDKNKDKEYELFKPTSEVLSYTRDVLDAQIEENEKMLTQRVKKQDFKERISSQAKEHIEESLERRQRRKQQPFIKEVLRYKMGKRICTNYEAVDLKEGKLMNINRLGKVEETIDETLYSAFIHKRENEDKIELKTLQNLPAGTPVLFTSESKIEEIVKNGTEEKKIQVLELLSGVKESKEMNFIGSMDKEGKITRSDENCPQEIKDRMKEEKEKYKEELKREEERKEEMERV